MCDCRIDIEKIPGTKVSHKLVIKYCPMHEAAPVLLEALKNLLSMARHYKSIPEGYNPEDEDEETWAVAMIYAQTEVALAQAKGEK